MNQAIPKHRQSTDDDLTDYILGTAPPERSREIKEIARHDEELTAKIKVMRMLFGWAVSSDEPHEQGNEIADTTQE